MRGYGFLPDHADTHSDGPHHVGNRDVPDPYGGDENAFTVCADLIEAAVQQHLP
ncbi:hypothetical protein [Streptomyces sp. NBC_01538]|uniref:hypothetical protein n=1 Tax=Streptomyces sp. NBC_01538 TaxID=2903897 RepID=UPI00386D1219